MANKENQGLFENSDEAIAFAVHSSACEDLTTPPEDIENLRKLSTGEISFDALIKKYIDEAIEESRTKKKYITGTYALNLPCSLDTSGDWHFSALDWDKIPMHEVESSFFKSYGLELHNDMPGMHSDVLVANHLRACLDLLVDGNFSSAQGMKNDFLTNDDLTEEAFRMVWKMRNFPNWKDIDRFMTKEYRLEWVKWKATFTDSVDKRGSFMSSFTFNEQMKHRRVIDDFLTYLNKETDQFILKGSTALMMCYDLDRFSEDVDLDTTKQNIIPLVKRWCASRHYNMRVTKDTDQTKRCMIDYDTESGKHSLKIEVSYRNRNIPESYFEAINGFTVYNINQLTRQISRFYVLRDSIYDLYDLCFINKNYSNSLSEDTLFDLSENISHKGLSQLEFLLKTQSFSQIDTDKLASDFLELLNRTGHQCRTKL